MKSRTPLAIGMMLVCITLQAYAADIETVLETAKNSSSTVRLLRLEKKSSELELNSSEIEKASSFSLTTGNSGFSLQKSTLNGNYVLAVSPSFEIQFANDKETALAVAFSNTSAEFDPAKSIPQFSSTPSITLVQPLNFLKPEDTTLEDLEYAVSSLQIEQEYQKGILDFEKKVLSSISAIVGYERDIFSTKHTLELAQEDLDRALAIRAISPENSLYTQQKQAIDSYRNTLQLLETRLDYAKQLYQTVTGSPYEPIEAIPRPELTFNPLDMGNSMVVLASIRQEIARQKLLEFQKDPDDTYTLSGTYSLNASDNILQYQRLQAGFSIEGDSFSVSANIAGNFAPANTGFGNGGGFYPTISLAGTWNESGDAPARGLQEEILQNGVVISGIAYQQELLAYRQNVELLAIDLQGWQQKAQELDLKKAYHNQILEETRVTFAKGISKARDVSSAEFTVALDKYEELLLDIEGLILQRNIQNLLL